MKTFLGRAMLFFFFAFISIAGIPQETEWADLSVTSSSEKALELYRAGMIALTDVNVNKAIDCFKKANEAEPGFVMPSALLAIYYFYSKDMTKFKAELSKAASTTYNLNQSETVILEALKKLAADPIAKVASYGEKLVKLNPKSLQAHQMMAVFQEFDGDYQAQNKTLQSMLLIAKDPAPIYNSLGYNNLAQNRIDDALPAFEKYISLAPKNPNAYDSMGDYYAKAGDYKKAQSYYRKAFRMDSINFKVSYSKAEALKDKIGN
jgi:tetratricopeptide (TPR) repeat protein